LDEFPNSEHILSGINAIQLANFKQNQSESTIYVINSFLSKNPNSIYAEQILIKKGEIYLENEDFEKAQSVFKEFVSTYPKSKFVANAYLWLAKCELKLERTEIANFYFDMILKDFPNSEIAIQTAIEYGIFNFELQNFNKSVEIYDKILVSQEASENLAELYYLKGLSLIELGKIEEVYNTFNQLLIKNPESIFADKAKLELGILEFSRKSYEVAEDVFREISNRRTDEIGVKSQFLLGEVLFEENRNSEAISAFVRLQTVFPKEKDWVAKSQLKLGDIYLKMKDKKKAKEMYQIVYNSNKNNEFGNEASKKLKGIK
jgi:TolA-binding protein